MVVILCIVLHHQSSIKIEKTEKKAGETRYQEQETKKTKQEAENKKQETRTELCMVSDQ